MEEGNCTTIINKDASGNALFPARASASTSHIRVTRVQCMFLQHLDGSRVFFCLTNFEWIFLENDMHVDCSLIPRFNRFFFSSSYFFLF